MTQEEKDLLLRDLCGRLPYGVKVTWDGKHPLTITPHIYCAIASEDKIDNLPKLLLRPISSMTEEEKLHVELTYGFFYHDGVLDNVHTFKGGGIYDRDGNYYPPCEYRQEKHVTIEQVLGFIHWLNVHHFDYHGLIGKGLAIAVTEENNPYKG